LDEDEYDENDDDAGGGERKTVSMPLADMPALAR
jgi:hypothetical protein